MDSLLALAHVLFSRESLLTGPIFLPEGRSENSLSGKRREVDFGLRPCVSVAGRGSHSAGSTFLKILERETTLCFAPE